MSSLKLYLLGPPRIEVGGMPVTVKRRKSLAILAYLAVTGESQRRDTLATMLWPDGTQRSARAALRRGLWALNQALGKGWLDIDWETVGLRNEAIIWLDATEFRQRLADCQTHGHPPDEVCPACLDSLTEAVSLYRDDFLTGFTLSDSPDFDEWQFFQAESLRQALASALERLVQGHTASEMYEPAIPYARRWLSLDPLHELAHRQLMQLYAWTGQRAAALRQYQECVRILDEELGLPPREKTTALYERIRRGLEEPGSREVEATGEQTQVSPVRDEPVALTFCATDLEGTSRLLEQHGEAMVSALQKHRQIIEAAVDRHQGRFLGYAGDSFLIVFEHDNPLPCALEIQQRFAKEDWGKIETLRVKIGLHRVQADQEGREFFKRGDEYFGRALHLTVYIEDLAQGGQILASASVVEGCPLPPNTTWQGLGEHNFKGFDKPQQVYCLKPVESS